MNNTLRKMKKNAKALSPVIASIILIAVTVAVSVAVAAWMGGLTIGLMGNTEQASITNAVFTDNQTLNVTVQNTGTDTVTITSGTVVGTNATLTPAGALYSIDKGASRTLTLALPGTEIFQSTASYQIQLTTSKGNTIVYTATYSGP